MPLNTPTPFAAALDFVRSKVTLPTSLTSAQLGDIEAKLLRRATFSARVEQADILSGLNGILEQVASGQLSRADARVALREFVEQSDYVPPEGEEGTIADLTTEARLNLMIDTNSAQAAGYGAFVTRQDPVLLDMYPCQELVRIGFRKVPRDWPERWEAADGELYDGRMVATVDDEIWQAIGDGEGGYNDTLGNPYPPFAFNSGMGLVAVSRTKAIALGVIEPDDIVKSQEAEFTDEAGVENLPGDILSGLLSALGEDYAAEGGILSFIA